MNGEDLRFLASRADGVRGRADDRLEEVHGRIRAARRRRAEALVGTCALVVAVLVGVALATGPTGARKGDAPTPPVSSETSAEPARKIVYSDDLAPVPHRGNLPLSRVTTVHVGDREVRIDQLLHTVQRWALVVTDGGAVYAKDDQTVWMTDGGEPQRIAEEACVDTTQATGLVAGTEGSLAVWFDCAPASRGADLVVFDAADGREIARHSVASCRGRNDAWPAVRCEPWAVVGEHVYFAVLVDADRDVHRDFVLDVVSDQVTAAGPSTFVEDLDSHPRALVIGDDRRTGLRTTGIGQDFRVVGSRLVPVLDVDGESSLARTTFITTSSDAVQLRLPSGYRAARSDSADDPPYFTLFEWVDDDTVALARGNTRTHYGDILVCHLPEGRCDVAVEAPQGDAIRLVVGGHLPG